MKTTIKRCLSKMDINDLREIAVDLGADRKETYGTSKQAMIIMIHELEDQKK